MPTASGAARRRAALYAGISLLIAGGTALLMQRIVSGYETQLSATREVEAAAAVVVAVRDLPAGVALKAADLRVESVPVALASGGYAAVADLVGKAPRERILSGEVLRRERMEGETEESHLGGVISDGWRAATVRVDKARGVGGMLNPGNRVDVIVTIRPDDNSLGANWVTETILQDARVLAVGPTVFGFAPADGSDADKVEENKGDKWDLVTLEVLPEEAEKLALATSRGELALTLRRPGDEDVMESSGPTVTNALLGLSTGSPERKPTRKRLPVARVPPPAPAAASTVEVIQGTRTSVQQYDAEGKSLNQKGR